jgi:hypothetical protein
MADILGTRGEAEMTDAERQRWRRHARLLRQQIYVFRSEDEAGDPIWVYDVLAPKGRFCIAINPSDGKCH